MKINALYRKEGQDDRNIEVIVIYKEDDTEERTRGRFPSVIAIVKNDSDEGISSDEIDTGIDKLSIPPRRSMETKWMRITKILNENPGFLRLKLGGR